MVVLRSGRVVGSEFDPWMGLSPDPSSASQLVNADIIRLVEADFRAMAADAAFNTATGNICALVAKFAGRELLVEYGYSTNSALEWEKLGQYDLASQTTKFSGEFSQQANTQQRNHTEPKLLQDFADTYLYEGSPIVRHLKWVVIVTDRPCCATCLSGSVQPFRAWSAANDVAFYVLDLQHQIQDASWSPVRTNFHQPA